MPSVPSGVSSQTRKKLKVFEYDVDKGNQPSRLANEEDDKENATHPLGRASKDAEMLLERPSQKISPERDNLARPCPQTPAKRIPLADLIGNTEEAFSCAAQDITPDDHVYWQNGPRSSDPASSIPSQQRNKKRAHSSSPVVAQADRISGLPTMDAQSSFNLQNLQQFLKTPQADPALDLWARYADSGMGKQDGSRQLGSFANFASSSPQTPGTTSSKKALRKAMSCGIEWPMSRAKRVKMDDAQSLQRAENVFAQSKEGILSNESSTASRVNLLMEKIQESLAKAPQSRLRHPSSSSPLPDKVQISDEGLGHGAQDHGRSPSRQAMTNTGIMSPMHEKPEPMGEFEEKAIGDESSEFGDDVFDDGFISAVANQPEAINLVTAHNVDRTAQQSDEDHFEEADFEDLVAQINEDAGSFEHDSKPQTIVHEPTVPAVVQTSRDVFEDDDDDEDLWNAVTGSIGLGISSSPKRKDAANSSKPISSRQAIKRYLIVDVVDSLYQDPKGHSRPEKVLSVKDEKTLDMKVILLRQCWLETRASKGSFVHLVGDFDRTGHCIVDDAQNFVITHPDILISATGVSDSFQCLRRSVLADRVKATSDPNPAQVYGSILHEIFQEALRANCWEASWLGILVEKVVADSIEQLYQINVQIPVAVEYLKGKMPELQAWASLFISAKPHTSAFAQERNGSQVNVAVNKLLEVEEHVWSPMYGLKGNIDATVQVVIQDSVRNKLRTLTVPLELKTGKRETSEAHRAQTALYTLLLQDRYDVDIMFGLLYYIETSKVFSIPAIRNEIRHMIIQRNELASFVHSKLDLPPMVKKPHMCNSCYAKTACWIYHRLKEDGDGQSSGLAEKFDTAMSHLTVADQAWFKKWDDLITKEEKDMMKFRRELWTMSSAERQKLGRCFGGVIIEPGSAQVNANRAKIDRFRYTFTKKTHEPGFSFAESQLTVGEPVVISDEQGHFALAMGYITNVKANRVSVAVDRRLHNVRTKGKDFNLVDNQTFRGIMEVCSSGNTSLSEPQPGDEQDVIYRIDKDEFNSGLATIRNNLIRMMEKDLFRARELRQLIINGQAPSFKPTSSAYTITETASQQLNVDQRRAIEKVMSAQDYALVLGMPGTGKTTTIAHIIRALVMQRKTVLLNSYTHTAVDNILLKIKDDNIKVLRIGSLGKIHPEVQAFADLAGVPKKTVAELENSYVNSQVVATTCLGVNHPIFNQRVFDYCIVDEASQITLPTCLSGLRMAKTFVLVGDHYQLPPLVQNKEAQEGGLDVSLFKILSDIHPESVVSLEHQYRMNADIMLLSNTLIYDGRLKCGTKGVGDRVLYVPGLEVGLNSHHQQEHLLRLSNSTIPRPACLPCPNDKSCWLRQSLTPEQKVVFLNTDRMGSFSNETANGARITNACEAILCTQLVSTLVSSGVAPREIGVITFYRSQLAFLRQQLGAGAGQAHRYSEVEMHTADKFQGRDKEVIVLSCVRSNDSGAIGDLLKDWRRVNVALTRARSKLIVVGSLATLGKSGNEVLEKFVGIIKEKGWEIDLKEGDCEGHNFDGDLGIQAITTQAQGGGNNGTSPNRREGGNRSGKPEDERNSPISRSAEISKTRSSQGFPSWAFTSSPLQQTPSSDQNIQGQKIMPPKTRTPTTSPPAKGDRNRNHAKGNANNTNSSIRHRKPNKLQNGKENLDMMKKYMDGRPVFRDVWRDVFD